MSTNSVSEFAPNTKRLKPTGSTTLREAQSSFICCTICAAKFVQRGGMLRHMRLTHKLHIERKVKSEPQKVQCTICNVTIGCRRNFARHMRNVHKTDFKTTTEMQPDLVNETQLACIDESSNSQLPLTKLANTSEEPVSCDQDNIGLDSGIQPQQETLQSIGNLDSIVPIDDYLLKILPASYLYKVLSFERRDDRPDSFITSLRINIKSVEDVKEWLDAFSIVTKCSFTVLHTKKVTGHYQIYNKKLTCHHNVQRGIITKGKHTECPTSLKIKVFSVPKKQRADRPRETEFRCKLDVVWDHNHPLVAADVLRRRPVSTQTKEKLKLLFKNGHTPSSALRSLKLDLQRGEDCQEKLADRSVCPDLAAVFYLYYKNFTSEDRCIKDSTSKLNSVISYVNENADSTCIASISDDDQRWTMAIGTPVMKRSVNPSVNLLSFLDDGIHSNDEFNQFILNPIFQLEDSSVQSNNSLFENELHESGSDNDSEANLIAVEEEFHNLFKETIGQYAKNNSKEYIIAYKSAIDTLKNIKTPNDGLSVLATFGKYCENSSLKK